MDCDKRYSAFSMISYGLIGTAVFWIADTFIDTYLFREGDLIQQVLHPEPMEIYFRGAVGGLFVIFGILGQRLLNQRRKAECLLEQTNRELEQKISQRTGQLEEVNQKLKDELEDRSRNDERINYLSFHDKLTGLYNRAYFEEELSRLDSERFLPISLIIGDVNGLKLINDAFGHQQGDKFLVRTAEIIKKQCRKSDVVARWGGRRVRGAAARDRGRHRHPDMRKDKAVLQPEPQETRPAERGPGHRHQAGQEPGHRPGAEKSRGLDVPVQDDGGQDRPQPDPELPGEDPVGVGLRDRGAHQAPAEIPAEDGPGAEAAGLRDRRPDAAGLLS
ncbi:MAG TPA: hypothetical protein DEO67_02435 [Candidatus Edwardsbacteria bacterium]|nr:hypothetical protein [Candidatus Edwardsbacteria bacterium]